MAEQVSLSSNLHAGSLLSGLERGVNTADTVFEQTIKVSRMGVETLGLAPRLARVGGTALAAASSEVLNVVDTGRADKIAKRDHLRRYEGLRAFDSMLVLGTFGADITRKTRDARALASLEAAEDAFAIRRDMLLGVWIMESVGKGNEKRRIELAESARALRRQIIGRYGLHMLAGEEPIKVSSPEKRIARQQFSPSEQLERAACEVEIEAQNKGMDGAPLGVLVMVDERRSSRMLGIKESPLKNGGVVYLDRVGRSIEDLKWRELPKSTVADEPEGETYPHHERRFTHGGTDRRQGPRRGSHARQTPQTEPVGVS